MTEKPELSDNEVKIVSVYADTVRTICEFSRTLSRKADAGVIERIDTVRDEYALGGQELAGEAFRDIYTHTAGGQSGAVFYIGAVRVRDPSIKDEIEELNQKKDRLAKIHSEYLKSGGRSDRIASGVHDWIDTWNASPENAGNRIPLGTPFIKSVVRKIRAYDSPPLATIAFYKRNYKRVERITLDTIHKRMELLSDGAYQAAMIDLKKVENPANLRFIYDSDATGYRARIKSAGSWASISIALPIVVVGEEWPEVQPLEENKRFRVPRSDTGTYYPIIESMRIYEKK